MRDYIHVLDLADAHVRALDGGVSGTFNLGNNAGHSVKEVLECCRRVTGHPIPAVIKPRRAGDPPSLVASSAKARKTLGWKPSHASLEAIVSSAWAWHKANPEGYRD